MSSMTMNDAPAAPTPRRSRRGHVLGRLALGTLAGFILASAFGTGALLAYERQYTDRILPGVTVAGVDVSGLNRETARTTLTDALAGYAAGTVDVVTAAGTVSVPYRALGRAPDVERLLDAAFSVGRTGGSLGRAVDGVRSLLSGTKVSPAVTLDPAAVAAAVDGVAARTDQAPTDASAAVDKAGFSITPASAGRGLDRTGLTAAILDRLADPAAPDRITLTGDYLPTEPAVTTEDAQAAVARAATMAGDLVLVHGKDSWTVPAATVRTWLHLERTTDGRYVAVVDPTAPTSAIAALSKKINQAAKDASFLIGRGATVVGVVAGRDGLKLDVAASVSVVVQAIEARGVAGAPAKPPSVELVVAVVKPKLSTEEAKKAAPLMTRISSWTTYYEVSERNGFSRNITIPTRTINGYVVAPGAVFDFWKAIGEVSYAKGYRDGGVIVNGHSRPTGALAGGICSTSTTLFNAAARGGYQILARSPHYYYITRYPKGLDATVAKSGSSAQTMSFRNDTKYPLLIRGYASPGIVRFEIWSVPTGRRVTFVNRVMKNYQRATSSVQRTTSLRPGQVKVVEYPTDGFDYWITRVVTDIKTGKVIHRDTWFSHYHRVDGLTLIGRRASTPTPTPAP